MKKELKKQVNQTARSIFLYSLILVTVTLLYTVNKSISAIAQMSADASADQFVQVLMKQVMDKAGILSLIGTACGLFYMAVRYRKKYYIREMMREKKTMKVDVFLALFCVFMSCQVLFIAATALAELLLNPIGFTLIEEANDASAASTTFSMFVYSALAAPVAEELVFRGYVMKKLLPFGKGFAILLSAVLFGLIHGNFLQGIFAVGAGLVLGFVAVEYSMKWSILIHILNNMVFSELMGRLAGKTAEPLKSVMEYGIPFTFFATACVILFLSRKKIIRWWKVNRMKKKECFYAFSSSWVIIFFIMEILSALNGIGRI